MKQTAVEWLFDTLSKKGYLLGSNGYFKTFKEAKAMEKEQIVDAVNDSQNPLTIHTICFNRIGKTDLTLGDCYYNEIYTNE